MMAANIARAAAALQFIDAGVERSEWVRAITAARAAGLDFDTVDQWSATAGNYKGSKDVQSVWRSIKADGGIGPGTLFHMARLAGWRDDGHQPTVRHARKPKSVASAKKPRYDAQTVWDRCIHADLQNSYIARKNGLPDGLRVYPHTAPRLMIAGQDVAGWLVLPCRTPAGELQSLQFIPPDQGKKLNLPGCSMAGGFHVVGDLQADGVAYVCEGISAAWAAWKATGRPALVAFGWGNVKALAPALAERFPALSLVLLPDVGKEQAAAAIAASMPRCGWVELPQGWPNNSDVGDFADKHGADELETLLANAQHYPTSVTRENVDRTNPANLRFCDARDGTDSTRPLSELGNAQRLQDLHGDALRFIPESKSWIVWRDGAWTVSADGGLVRSLATCLPEQIYREGAENLTDGEYFARWARNSQRQQTICAAVSLLSDMPTMRVPLADIDANPWLMQAAR